MKIHTNVLTPDDLRAALTTSGMRAEGVYFERLETKGSRSHRRAFNVRLGAQPRKGRRQSNPGTGSDRTTFTVPTYDEWGWWLAEVFRRDPYAICGQYKDAVDYHRQTNNAYLQAEAGVPHAYATTGGC